MELAINLGTDKTFVSRIETNTVKTIKSDMLAKVAQVLSVSADFLLGITDDPPFEDKALTALYEAEKAELEAEHEAQKKAK
jgi:transcriptional regulator with XRE-family HTH domain